MQNTVCWPFGQLNFLAIIVHRLDHHSYCVATTIQITKLCLCSSSWL